jgi:uncharacterized protein YwgA
MNTVLKLAELITPVQRIQYPRKLQTAIYLGQALTGCTFYEYYLVRGRVLSDELDQDLVQLKSIGMIERSHFDGRVELNIISQNGHRSRLVGKEKELSAWFVELLKEDANVLEAASTLIFFARDESGNPDKHLRWFKELPPEVLNRAHKLVPEVSSE